MRKLLFAMVVLAMISGMFLPALPAAATGYHYSLQILTINGQPISNPPESFTIPISIAGNCSATNFVGQISQYGVQIQWGDNSTVNVVPNLTQSGTNFSGTWGPVSHSYFPSGTYTIVVTLYHQMYPGAERSSDATFIFTLTVTFAGSNSPICQGSTLQLTGMPNGMNTYAWTGPNGFTSSLQNPSRLNATPSMSGTYTLTVTNATGTIDSSTTNVIVNPLPDSTITAPSAVCAESTGHTASVPDAGPGASYSWSVTGQGIITGVSNTRTIAWNASDAGTATISVIVTSVWGCVSTSTINVTVNPELVPTVSSNSPIYEEGTILLSGPSGMVSYSWTGPNGFTSSLQNPTIPNVTLAMAGTYGLTVTNTGGCTGTASTDVVIYAKPVATASNSSPACEGSTISLTGGPDGMVSYSWTGPNGFTSSLQNPTIPNVTLAMAGTYTLTVTFSVGSTGTATTIVTVNPKPVTIASSNSPVCEGSTISLTGGPNGMASYSWTGPNGLTSDLQNPSIPNATLAMAGTYTLTVTSPSGCTGPAASATVVVNAKPVANASSNSPVCESSTISLTGGPDGMASYSWTGPNGFTSDLQNPSIPNTTLAMAGTYTLTVTNTSGCTGPAASTTVVVNAKPAANASSNSPVCAGSTISLSGAPSGMASYSWTGPNGFTSDLQNPSIPNATLAMGGTYTLTVTNTSGCTDTTSTDVVVNAKPVTTASSNSPVCVGNTISLTGGPDGMASYSWTGPNGFTSNVQNPSIPDATSAMAGTYTLTVTSSSGCTGNAASTNVVVNAKPAATASSNSPVYETTTISLTGSPSGMASYSWTGPNGFTSNLQNPTITNVTLDMAGTYSLTVTNTSGCTDTDSTDVVVNAVPTATSQSNSPVCAGSTISLFGGPGDMASYSWTGPNGFTSNLQNPTIPDATTAMTGTYTFTVTYALGYSISTSTDVVVNALPVANASSNSPVCAGSTISLTGGPDGMASYSWTGPNGFTSSLQNPSIPNATLAMGGTYTLTVTNTGGCTDTTSTDVVVNAKPVTTASSNSPVCEGSTISLTGGPDGMASYSWTGPNGFTSNVQNPSIPDATSAMAGTYTLTVTSSSGCTGNAASTDVVVNAKPVATASSNSPVCVGSTLSLTGAPSGMASYSWTGPNGFTSNVQNPSIPNATLAMAGTYTLTVTNTSGCTGTDSTDVVVNAKPVATASSNSPVYETTTISLTGSPDGMASYSWTGPNGFTSSLQSPTITNATLAMAGTYTLTVTSTSSCTNSAAASITVIPVPVPSAPTLLSPANGAYAQGTSITYRWNTSAWATSYKLTVSTSSNFSDTSKYKINIVLGNVTQYTDTGYPNTGTHYYWWVNACNSSGCAPQAQVNANGFNFINWPPPPAAPMLVGPGNAVAGSQGPGNATYVPGTSITYSWNASPGATMYYLTVSTSPDPSDSSKYKFSGLLGNVTQYNGTGLYPNNGTTYYWWLSAGNSAGWASPSDVLNNGMTFINGTEPPSAPKLVSPGNGTVVPGTSITYKWNASPRATMYYITVSTSSDPSDTSKYKYSGLKGNITQYTDTGYPNNGNTYYWWISAGNSGGWSPASGFYFTNYTAPPPAPTLVYPGNNTYVPGTSITYQWNAAAGATMYYLTVSTSSNYSDSSKYKYSGLLGNVTQYNGTGGYPNNGVTYYWWVSAGNSGGWSQQSQVIANGFAFHNAAAPPVAPTLVSPINGAVASGTSVTYKWNASAGATMYYLVVSTSSDPSDSSKYKYSGLLGAVTQYTNTGYPNNGTTYYWWIAAGNSGGWSPSNGSWFVNHP
jgi:hypothetical protein